MTKKILFINDAAQDFAEGLCYFLAVNRENLKDVEINICGTNEQALERVKDNWDIVFYDIGMDPNERRDASFLDLRVSRKLRENLRESTPLIGTSYHAEQYSRLEENIFNEIIDTYDYLTEEERLYGLFVKYGILSEKR